MRSLKEVLAQNAPGLLARTRLPRKHPDYLTQRAAFDLFRQERMAAIAREAPDLFARLSAGHPDHLNTWRAIAIWQGRKKRQ